RGGSGRDLLRRRGLPRDYRRLIGIGGCPAEDRRHVHLLVLVMAIFLLGSFVMASRLLLELFFVFFFLFETIAHPGVIELFRFARRGMPRDFRLRRGKPRDFGLRRGKPRLE